MTDPASSTNRSRTSRLSSRPSARDGFVHAPAVLSDAEVAATGPPVDLAVETPQAQRSPRAGREDALRAVVHPVRISVGGFPRRPAAGVPSRDHRAGRRRFWARTGADVARSGALQGGRRPRNRRPPGPRLLADRGLDAITAWTPLVDVDEASGCMGYVAGTQAGDCDYIDIFNAPGSGKALEDKYRDNPPRFIPARPAT